MDWILLGICCAAALYVGFTAWRETVEELRREDAEEAAFQRRREERRAQVIERDKAVARRVLLEQCESIYIGRWRDNA